MKLRLFIRCPRCGIPQEISKSFFEKNTPNRPMPERYGRLNCFECRHGYTQLIREWTPLIYKLELRNIWNEVNEQEI